MFTVSKFEIGSPPKNAVVKLIKSNIGLTTIIRYFKNGKTSDIIDTTNKIVKPNVNIGISIIFAKSEMTFKVLKKYAIINISDIEVAKLIASPFASQFGIFALMSANLMGLNSKVIPKTHEKLIRKLTSNITSGLTKNRIHPARDIDESASYSRETRFENSKHTAIMHARSTETEKSQMYA